jgi:glycine cleavage system regulatory protein
MQSSLVLTVLGPDRAGLVKSIAEAVKAHQGNWQESRMVHLAGQFAGLAHVTLPQENVADLAETLHTLQNDGLQILIQYNDNPTPRNITPLTLELLGHDRPGIIHDITRQLAALNVNIEELVSEQRTAPMSSEVLFYAHLKLGLPEGVMADDVQGAFEAMPDPLTVDITFS